MSKMYSIKAVCNVPYDELNYNDKDCYDWITMPHIVCAENEDEALDHYHDNVPIKILDHFDINVIIL